MKKTLLDAEEELREMSKNKGLALRVLEKGNGKVVSILPIRGLEKVDRVKIDFRTEDESKRIVVSRDHSGFTSFVCRKGTCGPLEFEAYGTQLNSEGLAYLETLAPQYREILKNLRESFERVHKIELKGARLRKKEAKDKLEAEREREIEKLRTEYKSKIKSLKSD